MNTILPASPTEIPQPEPRPQPPGQPPEIVEPTDPPEPTTEPAPCGSAGGQRTRHMNPHPAAAAKGQRPARLARWRPVLRWPWLPMAGLGAAGLGAALLQGLALGRALRRGGRLVRTAHAFAAHPPRARARVLLLGDSTGVGAAEPVHSLPGLLAEKFPGVEIVNACSNGARVADTLVQWHHHAQPGHGFDLVLVLAGGNDVLHLTPPRQLAQQAQALLQALQPQVRNVVWLGSADIGTAPALKPPLSWVYGWLCRRAMRLLDRTVGRAGAQFIDFSSGRHSRVFAGQPERYFASDGLHPSSASYRVCFDELQRRVPLASLLRRGAGRELLPGTALAGSAGQAAQHATRRI